MSLANTTALCTLADLKDDLGITDNSKDAALERRILAASDLIVQHLGRDLRRVVGKSEDLPGYGTPRLIVSLTPLETLTSVAFNGAIVDSGNYSVEDPAIGTIFNPATWIDTAVFRSAVSPTQKGGDEQRLYTVVYTGGYALPNDTAPAGTALPGPIVEACLALATVLHRRRGRDSAVQAETVGEASQTFGMGSAGGGAPLISGFIAELLAPYRRPA